MAGDAAHSAGGAPSPLASPHAVRPEGGAVLELHAHSLERSRDSGVTAGALVAQAAARGLDGVCLTEHNARWSDADTRALTEQHGVAVLPGMELGTDIGHVLAFGLPRFTPELLEIERLHAIALAEGAALVLAHPMRLHNGRRAAWHEVEQWFDGIEVINGDHSDGDQGYFVRLAGELGIALVAGSDAHSIAAVGRVVTVFPERVEDVGALVAQMRARRTAIADLRPAVPRAGAGGTVPAGDS